MNQANQPLEADATTHRPAYLFRCAEDSDCPAICALVNAAYRPAEGNAGWTSESALVEGQRTTPEQLQTLLRRPRSTLLLACCAAGKIQGCVHIEAEQQDAYIGMLAVWPQQQGSGLGKQLLLQAEQWAIQVFGATQLLLSVIQQRSELRAYYLRRGYLPNGQGYPYPLDAGAGVPFCDQLWVEVLAKQAATAASQASPAES